VKQAALFVCGAITILFLFLTLSPKRQDYQCMMFEFEARDQCIISLGFQDSKTLIAGSTNGKVSIWDIRRKRLINNLDASNPAIVACQPNGNCFAVNWQNECVKKINIRASNNEFTYSDFSNLEALKFSQSGKLLAAGGLDARVKVWEVASGRSLAVLKGHTHSIDTICFFGDRLLATGGTANDSMYIWDLATTKMLTTLDCHMDRVSEVFFLNDTTLLSMGAEHNRIPSLVSKGSIRIWDITSGTCIISVSTKSAILSGAISSDKKNYFCGCADGSILTGKCDSLQILDTFFAHRGNIRSLALSLDGRSLASTSDCDESTSSSIIRFWDVSCLEH
jgi:WD40 repeat protein